MYELFVITHRLGNNSVMLLARSTSQIPAFKHQRSMSQISSDCTQINKNTLKRDFPPTRYLRLALIKIVSSDVAGVRVSVMVP